MTLVPGAPAPLFAAPSPVNPEFAFGSLGGRYILLTFLPEPGPERDAAIRLVRRRPDLFDDEKVMFFGVLPDRESFAQAVNTPPCRWFGDPDGELRRLYGATNEDGSVCPQWVLIDPMLRIMGSAPLQRGQSVIDQVARMGDPDDHAGVELHAPVLITPRIFEPALCGRLIEYYRAHGGQPTGVMRQVDGRIVGVLDDFKRRRDASIDDRDLIDETRAAILTRLAPQIGKAFQFKATRIERFIVACYDGETGGYFSAHRDNTTVRTAHRKFAVSINLNADFEGGDLRFPEFGRRAYRPPPGDAVVFSCSLLHEVEPVTRGARYAFLPFLYDEDGTRIREANLSILARRGGADSEAAGEQA